MERRDEAVRMPFGKYRGVDIAFINSGYFKWLLEQDWFLKGNKNELLILAIEGEMEIRTRGSGHFYEDKVKIG